MKSNQFNYAYSPTSLAIPVNMGSYQLSFGAINAAALAVAAIALLLFCAAQPFAQMTCDEKRRRGVSYIYFL